MERQYQGGPDARGCGPVGVWPQRLGWLTSSPALLASQDFACKEKEGNRWCEAWLRKASWERGTECCGIIRGWELRGMSGRVFRRGRSAGAQASIARVGGARATMMDNLVGGVVMMGMGMKGRLGYCWLGAALRDVWGCLIFCSVWPPAQEGVGVGRRQ